MRIVEPGEWAGELARAHARGLAYLDFLTAVDRIDSVDVIVHVLDVETGDHELLGSTVPTADPRLDSITPVFAGASWHEREAAEMFGIEFVGHPDPRPLLLRTLLGRPPLRKDVVLAARLAVEWPGAADPGDDGRRAGNPSRRRQGPPGAPDEWLEETP